MWLGHGFRGMAAHFINRHYEDYAAAGDHREGMIRVSGVVWFTNLDHDKRHEPLVLTATYSPDKYPTYDNYDAIEVSKTKDIPCDYYGVMGVPITFLDKYCPEQFEIVGITDRSNDSGIKTRVYTAADADNAGDLNARGVVRLGGRYKAIYARILIKRRAGMWLGPSIHSGDREFGVPAHYPLEAAGHRVDDKGRKFIRVKGVRWFTNMDHAKRHEPLVLTEMYYNDKYPTYDNYNAINVDRVKDIPMDFFGIMGVPVTFLDKYCPEQFEIVGSDYDVKEGLLPELVRPGWEGKLDRGYVAGVRLYARILIRRKAGPAATSKSPHPSTPQGHPN
jgi:hypothetical protein